MKKVVLVTAAYDFGSSLKSSAKQISGWPKTLTTASRSVESAALARFTTLLAPPLGTLAVGSYLAMHEVPVEVIDVQMDFGIGLDENAKRAVAKRVARYLLDQADDIAWIGVSQLSATCTGLVLIEEIGKTLPDKPLVLGGYFPSSTYRSLLQEYPSITAIVRGDGEAAALEISRSLNEGRSFLCDRTPNLAWLVGGEIRTTPVVAMALEELPVLDFRLLKNPYNYQIIELMTSRGCPFQCNYCLESSMRSYSTYSLDWVSRQLTHIETELSYDRIFFFDPVFGFGRERTLGICEIMREHEFTYALESRVDVLKPDMISVLREVGVELIYFGVESASEGTLLRMGKVPAAMQAENYVKSAFAVLEACFRNGITPFVGIMLGFPGDSEEDYQTTLDFIKELGQVHDRVTLCEELQPGFVPLTFHTKVYDGSPLMESLGQDYPQATLRSDPFKGRRTVLSPSPGLEFGITERYQAKTWQQGRYTPEVLRRFQRYSGFSMESFLLAHPELTDEEGVAVLGDSLRRFPQEIDLTSWSSRKETAT